MKRLLAGLLLMPCAVLAQAWPAKTLTYISSFPPGPGPDLYMRPLMQKIGEALGQTIVTETRVGGGGTIAHHAVARAAPDGYTIGHTTNSTLIQRHVQPDIGVDSLALFAHVTRVTLNGSVLVVSATSPARSVEELVALAKASPGKLNYGSGGTGTPSHLGGATLQSIAGVQVVHVPFKNSADVVPSLIRGDLQFAFQVASFAAPQIRAGKLRLIGVTGSSRMKQYPDAPTLNEVLKSELLVQENWLGLGFPAKTPAPVVQRFFTEAVKAMADPSVREGAERGSNNLAPSQSPEEYTAYIRKENEKWREIVRLSGVHAQLKSGQ
jgi:tripartite-type tricarboxylate transporter receptor subunit TctC